LASQLAGFEIDIDSLDKKKGKGTKKKDQVDDQKETREDSTKKAL